TGRPRCSRADRVLARQTRSAGRCAHCRPPRRRRPRPDRCRAVHLLPLLMISVSRPTPAAERHHAAARASVPAGRVIGTMFLALLVASLLGANSLERVAERQPYGATRDLELAITKPLRSVSHALFLDRPRDWLA